MNFQRLSGTLLSAVPAACLLLLLATGYSGVVSSADAGMRASSLSLAPTSVIEDSPAFTLSVSGHAFTPRHVVYWDNAPLVTTYVSDTQLTAAVPASLVTSAGQVQINVSLNGRVSGIFGSAFFYVNNPIPALSSLQPNSLMADAKNTVITLLGAEFVAGSRVYWNAQPLTTTYNSATQLQAQVPATALAKAGTSNVMVVNPAPGGGSSNKLVVTVTPWNPIPSVATAALQTVDYQLTVRGRSFLPNSTIDWNGTPIITSYLSSTELLGYVNLTQVNQAGSAAVMVSNPAPGGGVSNSIGVTVYYPLPQLTYISTRAAYLDGPGFTLSLGGAEFAPSAAVYWNATPLATTYFYSALLQAVVPASLLTAGGVFAITVKNPGPGGGASDVLDFFVLNPSPKISGIAPDHVDAGGGAFTLTVLGSQFVTGAVVQWNGSNRDTTFVSSTKLKAQISATDISAIQTASITVTNPQPGGGQAPPLAYPVGYQISSMPQVAKDAVWDAVHQVIYLSVPSGADPGQHPSSIITLDPVTGSVVQAVPVSSNPDALAVSDDGTYLYAGLDAASPPVVQRFTLPGLNPDISWALGAAPFPESGQYFALDIEVAPSASHTTAISRGLSTVSPQAEGGITIFDDATPRPNHAPGFGESSLVSGLYDSVQWGPDVTTLYAANGEDSGWDFYTLAVTATGVARTQDYRNAAPGFFKAIHYDPMTDLVYTDYGTIIDPHSGTDVGTFVTPDGGGITISAVDSGLNKLFTARVNPLSDSGVLYLESFDLTSHAHLSTITLPVIYQLGLPQHLIRWGAHGLALLLWDREFGSPQEVILISGQFVD